MGEVSNFKEISATIGQIGWIPYIISLVVLIVIVVVIEIIVAILGVISVLGMIINLVFIAPVMILEARYLGQVYDECPYE